MLGEKFIGSTRGECGFIETTRGGGGWVVRLPCNIKNEFLAFDFTII